MITNHCKTCSQVFIRPNNPNRPYSFCSYKCTAASRKNTKVKINCAFCTLQFSVWPYQIKNNRRTCSKPCADKFKDGGKTTEAIRIRTSTKYANWRKSVFKRDNYTCVECGDSNSEGRGVTVVLHADHIKPFSLYPELRLDITNGRTLCVPCHKATGTWGRVGIFRNLTNALEA